MEAEAPEFSEAEAEAKLTVKQNWLGLEELKAVLASVHQKGLRVKLKVAPGSVH